MRKSRISRHEALIATTQVVYNKITDKLQFKLEVYTLPVTVSQIRSTKEDFYTIILISLF